MKSIKVMVVDDSAVVRKVVGDILCTDPAIELVGAASDPIFALERINRKGWPDVIILDIEMPRMDGITFLNKIMREHPTPVVICSALAEKGDCMVTMEAMAAGAVEIITKPKMKLKNFLEESGEMLIRAVKGAAQANLSRLKRVRHTVKPSQTAPIKRSPKLYPKLYQEKLNADVILKAGTPPQAMKLMTEEIIAIGTSTGGTNALEHLLSALPRLSPGIVIVQHMPEQFTAAFAKRLDSLCEIEVREARDQERVLPGLALIAPGGKHLLLKRHGANYIVEVVDGPLVNRHRPAVDVLFRSVARYAGSNAMGIIMTGMGDDGARGLAEIHAAGGYTVAQDEESCVVFGMPKEAIKLGCVDAVIPLGAVAGTILQYAKREKEGDGKRERGGKSG